MLKTWQKLAESTLQHAERQSQGYNQGMCATETGQENTAGLQLVVALPRDTAQQPSWVQQAEFPRGHFQKEQSGSYTQGITFVGFNLTGVSLERRMQGTDSQRKWKICTDLEQATRLNQWSKLSSKEKPTIRQLFWESYQLFNEESTPVLLKLFQK